MTALNFSGSSNMRISGLAQFLVAVLIGAPSYASDQPPFEDSVQVSAGAEATYQVEADRVRRDWHLDPAIFTDISPVSAPDVAIKLPEGQREEP
jgi:hypothetical protein